MSMNIVGVIGSIILPVIPIPQIYEICLNKSSENISLMYIFLQIVANSMFFAYGLSKTDYVIFIPNIILVAENLLLILLAVYFSYYPKYHNMDLDFKNKINF
jgi:uncharacterized protein with PQ loop repeat